MSEAVKQAPLVPLNKIKQMMQENPDVGRLRQSDLEWMATAAEGLLQTLLDESGRTGGEITVPDLQQLIQSNTERFLFLQGVLDDIKEEKAPKKKPAAKKRKRPVDKDLSEEVLQEAIQMEPELRTKKEIVEDEEDYD